MADYIQILHHNFLAAKRSPMCQATACGLRPSPNIIVYAFPGLYVSVTSTHHHTLLTFTSRVLGSYMRLNFQLCSADPNTPVFAELVDDT